MKKTSGFLLFTLLFFSLSSCNLSVTRPDKYLYLADTAEIAIAAADDEPEDTKNLSFSPLNLHTKSNLKAYSNLDGSYVWVRMHFTIPDNLKNKELALEIPYLHFAEQVFLNGTFIGQYGRFPPKPIAAQYTGHYFLLSTSNLNQKSENELLLKVFCMGSSTISDRLLIGDFHSVKRISYAVNFFKSNIYFLFEGAMATASILFFMLYIYRRKNKSYFAFAILNLLTTILCIPFFSAEIPLYASIHISHITFMKFTMYCIMPLATFTASEFMLMHVEYKSPKWILYTRLTITFAAVIICACVQKYSILMKICPIIVIFLFAQLLSGFLIPMVRFKKDPVIFNRMKHLFIGFTPLACGMLLDFFLKFLLKDDLLPYFTVFGFMFSDLIFFLSFTINFNKTTIRAEFLNTKLEQEVSKQTKQLTEAKSTLEYQIKRAKTDLEMASIVQAGFLPPKNHLFDTFSLSVFYKPLSNVSGDFYDFYEDANQLKGLSIFDVSGHGIAASLITLLGKNIVSECFYNSIKENQKINLTLTDINTRVCQEKGNVENYLTGLLFKIDEKTYNDKKTNFTFANAGHPHPLLFRAKTKEIIDLKPEDGQIQYGAVGLFENEVSYAELSFYMEENDILLCYTDGITEAFNRDREQFGLERLKNSLINYSNLRVDSIRDKIYEDLTVFINNAPMEDDITFLILKKDSTIDDLEEL